MITIPQNPLVKMKLVVLFCFAVAYIACASAILPGGLGDEETATPEIQGIADRLRKTIESSAGVIRFPRFKVITFKKQTVAGTNIYMKIEIGPRKYIHVRIFRSLGGLVKFTSVKKGYSRYDPLEYFE